VKVAIIHDWLVTYAGAERVLEQMLLCFPEADLFSMIDFLPAGQRSFILDKPVTTSFIQHLPRAKKIYRTYLPLMPLAVEQFELSGYDLILSSSYAVAKGVLVGPDQLHLSYTHTPARYAWDMQARYLAESGMAKGVRSWLARWFLHKIRIWDVRTSAGVDQFIANSRFIARRIQKAYRRPAEVIYPPVDTDKFGYRADKDDFYVTASRMVPYKKMPMIVEAFSRMPDRRLIVIGSGPELEKCKALAGPNVTVMGWQPENVLRDHLQRARAYLFAAEEDFGIAPLEAQACGTPVIAFGKGGVLETVRGLDVDSPTGLFFTEQTPEALADAIATFERESHRIAPAACRQNAMRFSTERFRAEFKGFVLDRWNRWNQEKAAGDAGRVETDARDVTTPLLRRTGER
jgi:glycosyltransferase involved in cell wall biosynthesis